MRIGIDARELGGHPTGVGRYLSGLLVSWSALAEAADHEFVLFSPSPLSLPAGLSGEVVLVPGSGDVWWEQWDLASAANRQRLDVFFAPGYTAPLRVRAPVALVVHDVSFAAHPEWFGWREGTRRRTLTRLSAEKARTIVTVSDFSKAEIVRHLGVSPDKVRRIYEGSSIPAGSLTPDRGREPLVLFVGSVLNRRRVPELIHAFGALAAQHPSSLLAIVGDNRTYPRQDLVAIVERAGLRTRVLLRNYVDEATLADLYRRATVFAFLSEYEGFGLTPLEALASGVPPVLLDTPVAREVCGEAARYVDGVTIAAVAPVLEEMLFDERARAAVLERAPAVLARYSWERAGRETLDTLVGAAQ